MSTRAEILITTKDGAQQKYYHHWDGYPWGVGYDLVRMALKNPESFNSCGGLRNTLTHAYEPENVLDEHGDTEYYYIVESKEDGIRISYKSRGDGYIGEKEEEWREPKKMFYMAYVAKIDAYGPVYLNIE